MQFLNDYMTVSERENAIFEAQMNRESIALDNKFDTLMQEHALRLSDIDLSVALERYSDDDTQALFERELTIYTEGVKEWWAEFKKWFSGLISKLCGKAPEGIDEVKNKEGKVTLPCDVDEVVDSGNKILDKIKNFFKYKKDDGTLDVAKIAAEVGGTAVIGAMLGIGGKKLSDTFKEKEYEIKTLPSLWDKIKAFFDKSKKTVDDIKDDAPEGKSIKDILMKVVNPIKDILGKVKSAISGLIHKDKPEEGQKALPEGDKKEGDDTGNTDNAPENKEKSIKDINKSKARAKSRILNLAKSWGFYDRSKGNKVTIADMENYVKQIEERANKQNDANKKAKYLDEVKGFKEVIKDCKDHNITEFAVDEIITDSIPMMEATMTPIDDIFIERELMLMTESEEADVAEFIDLVDSL